MKFTVGHLLLVIISIIFLLNNCSCQKKIEASRETVTPVSSSPESSSVSREVTPTTKTVTKEEVVCAYKSDEAAQEFVSNVKSNFNTTDVEIEARGNCVIYKWYK
ncbi:hypothetical protein [Nostoc sp. 'Lobaria pulmonaria (5183) cyanobiont']|uniref:hypothetical protein n=1 Tax=Nostoc sp. 'Lobaria pulmonaria (5183) cyanobiont' TaxID=1618022 RepID=UPI000CF32D96|nr:hypothetical protein [Nostoc sp. 'Lobaria pulmonaria (5183) cyanobiont']AVH71084.1 hypothetical protein NLP_2382 [Nostoc sp. 'Lobaria pulmonaria (5183) cyanobiont']